MILDPERGVLTINGLGNFDVSAVLVKPDGPALEKCWRSYQHKAVWSFPSLRGASLEFPWEHSICHYKIPEQSYFLVLLVREKNK